MCLSGEEYYKPLLDEPSVDVDLISQQFPFQRQSNASQTLCDIIRLSRDQANQMQDGMEMDPLLACTRVVSFQGLIVKVSRGKKCFE